MKRGEKRTWKSKGFTGKKHSTYSRWLMSEGRKLTWAKKKKNS